MATKRRVKIVERIVMNMDLWAMDDYCCVWMTPFFLSGPSKY